MNRYFIKLLNLPLNSVRTSVLILSDGGSEILTKMKYVFSGGPSLEMIEYFKMTKRFFRSLQRKFRSRLVSAKQLLSYKSSSQRKRTRHSTEVW